MRNLESICKKIMENGIQVISFSYSENFDLFDHEINLANGIYLQISDEYLCIYKEKDEETTLDLGTFNTIKSTISKLKEIYQNEKN